MTDDLIAFIQARLDEDKARADAAHGHGWFQERELTSYGLLEEADARLIAAHADPARVLREIEATRGILAMYDQAVTDAASSDYIVRGPARVVIGVLVPVLCHLARSWSNHPDYQADNWKPAA